MWKQRAATLVLTVTALAVPASGAAAPAWAIDPADPGANRPTSGQSLFAQITAEGVPFPFDALVRKIENAAGCQSGKCITSALVPFSRSLQRMAAATCSPRIAFTSAIKSAPV
jgi:hypothetical protein